ncbi:hypothetical protein FGB62_145g013 [Gracilaria domingensis]|nr:hypothetical protein FGB62_145g013 [Gracilaria domingensis]
MSHISWLLLFCVHLAHRKANSVPVLFTSSSEHSRQLLSFNRASSVPSIPNTDFNTAVRLKRIWSRMDILDGTPEPEQTQDTDILYTLDCDGDMCMSEDEQQLICQIPPKLPDNGQNALGNDSSNNDEGVLTIMATSPSRFPNSEITNYTAFCMPSEDSESVGDSETDEDSGTGIGLSALFGDSVTFVGGLSPGSGIFGMSYVLRRTTKYERMGSNSAGSGMGMFICSDEESSEQSGQVLQYRSYRHSCKRTNAHGEDESGGSGMEVLRGQGDVQEVLRPEKYPRIGAEKYPRIVAEKYPQIIAKRYPYIVAEKYPHIEEEKYSPITRKKRSHSLVEKYSRRGMTENHLC